ncbi:MAG: hypothetical protein AB7Q17_00700 [Phycisphaerae bacterium]
MTPPRGRAWLVVVPLCVLAGFSATYAWQAQRAVPHAANPADVLGGWLQLLPDEVARLQSVDPSFAVDRTNLERDLATERDRLARLFERPTATDEAVLEQVERTIAVHDALERRVARYLLAVRPHLSDEQRSRLFERCARAVRDAGGWRWRHGQPAIDASERGMDRGPGGGRGFGRGRGGGRLAPATSGASSQPSGESP